MSRNIRLQLESATVQCPHCWEEIELTLDLSSGDQDYTEDCQVCCNPMQVSLRVDEGGEFQVSVDAE